MTEIPFTQFLRPHGERKQTFIDVPHNIALMAQRFIEEGGSYTSELVQAGIVSLCAEFTIDGERQDIVALIAPNGPGIEQAVERVVRESYEFLQKHEARS